MNRVGVFRGIEDLPIGVSRAEFLGKRTLQCFPFIYREWSLIYCRRVRFYGEQIKGAAIEFAMRKN